MPIGHSVDATPLQMAAAYAAIANNGTYVQPHLIKETIGPDGKRTPRPGAGDPAGAQPGRTRRRCAPCWRRSPPVDGRHRPRPPRSPATGSPARPAPVWRLVDGKTQPGEVASFIGMAPAEKPRYVVAVFAYTPDGGGGGGRRAGVPRDDGFTLRHYRVPPSATNRPPVRIRRPEFVVFPR